jgi:hypothetical protein
MTVDYKFDKVMGRWKSKINKGRTIFTTMQKKRKKDF